MTWHYSKRLPMPPLASIGAWEDGAFIGAIVFGRGANMNAGKPYGLSQTQIAELVRVALSRHGAPVSRIVSIAVRILRKSSPGLRALVSYADPREGHVGTIYQAMGWIYDGLGESHREFFHDGRWKHKREVTAGAFGAKVERIDWNALPSRRQAAKHRYVLPLCDEIQELMRARRAPYPKQSSGEKGSPRGTTVGEGGSIPTSPHLFDLGARHFPPLPVEALKRLDVLAEEEADTKAQMGMFDGF